MNPPHPAGGAVGAAVNEAAVSERAQRMKEREKRVKTDASIHYRKAQAIKEKRAKRVRETREQFSKDAQAAAASAAAARGQHAKPYKQKSLEPFEVRRKLAAITVQKEDLEVQLAASNAEKKTLNERINGLTGQLVDGQDAVKESERKTGAAHQERDEARQAAEEARQNESDADAKYQKVLVEQYEAHRKSVKSMFTLMDDLSLAAAQGTDEERQSVFARLEQDNKESTARYTQAEELLDATEQQLNAAQAELVKMKAAYKDVKEKLKHAMERNLVLEEENAELKQLLKETRQAMVENALLVSKGAVQSKGAEMA